MTQTNFLGLALSGQIDALDTAWAGEAKSPGPVTQHCQTIEVLCGKDMAAKAVQLATVMIDALSQKERARDAAQLAMTVVRLGAQNESLLKRLFSLMEQEHGSEDW